ncbi:MAG TPA: hypothetical protein DD979_03575 [Gammaproteobacteria bacterium]|jgi:hypothetical protein|nr:hypothetical protein [Gammaproteobacteria bacterium]
MIKSRISALSLAMLGAMASNALHADDVRSLSMGGAAVSAGTGVAGVMGNPSLLLRAQNQEDDYQFHIGLYAQVRDNADIADEVDKHENTIDNIDAEVDAIAAQDVTCVTPNASRDDVCLTGTQALADLADSLLDTFENVDGEPVDARIGIDIGFSVLHTSIPFTVHLSTRATGSGQADISQEDVDYTSDLANVLGDDNITLGEIEDTAAIALTNNNGTIQIEEPEDVLTSEATGSAVLRTQLALAFAKSFAIGEQMVDIGVTPKLSSLRAGDFTKPIDELDDDDTDLGDEFEESENKETSFTFDLGASTTLPDNDSVRFGGVVRNVLKESIESKNGFEFETTPQAIVSATYHNDTFLVTGDLALNKAKEDNFETQMLSVGTELTMSFFSFRAGIGHDLAADDEPTTAAVGVGLGPVDIGFRLNGSKVHGGIQLALSF